MKIGLYLEDMNKKGIITFYKTMHYVKKSDIDLLVFPEDCYTPFVNKLTSIDIMSKNGYLDVENHCRKLSKYIGCAVIFSSVDKNGVTYSIYVNAFCSGRDTFSKLYIKHIDERYSAFERDNYRQTIKAEFEPVIYKGLKIGMTIGADCNYSLLSRTYGKQGIDILINSSKGNVLYDRWDKFNKVRSIENNCFNFCTMGYSGDYKEVNSYVYGYTPTGKMMKYRSLNSKNAKHNDVGKIFVYDTSIPCDEFDIDKTIGQEEIINDYKHYYYTCGGTTRMILNYTEKIDDNIFVYHSGEYNIVICLLNGEEILFPEKVLSLLHNSKLKTIKNKKYIIVNQWKQLDDNMYKTQISDVLKVRAMENSCVVILESDKFYKCYQCDKDGTVQVVKATDGKYGLNLDLANGPEAVWKDNDKGFKENWRSSYEALLNYVMA
ncbi:hypothetical protein H2684_09470 [Clostridium sp. cel8]|uniref:nitrilase-related carbon-nitrogen hydrolase n=1 Tax=Clostridium sp. cel8 TaxID=2663123 RepID=UPI0015F4B871|nr:nitrilase-related carbon-nitrogen hydrolase [Clostridium sp. cel8]MBA5851531.1 hypothetical protein [Clostridium sp. cel8]